MSEEKPLALIIEDDFDASVIFAKAMEALGFQTETIASGNKAVERLKTATPEVIILDLHLPEVLGTSIMRQLRADERLKNALVIVATADPRSADLIQEEADMVLLKPTTYSQVRDLTSRLVTSRHKKADVPVTPADTPPAAVEKKEEPPAEVEKKEEQPGVMSAEVEKKEEIKTELPAETAQKEEQPAAEKPTPPSGG